MARPRTLVIAFTLAVLPCLRAPRAAGPAMPPDTPVARALRSVRGRPIERVWDAVHQLRPRTRDQFAADLAEFVTAAEFRDLDDDVRFATAALARLTPAERTIRELALTTLAELAKDGSDDDVRIAALRMLGVAREPWARKVVESVLARAVAEDEPHVLIAASVAIDRLDNTFSQQKLIELISDHQRSFDVRAAAALAFAQTSRGDALDRRVRPYLQSLRLEPSDRGRLARLLLDRARVENGDLRAVEERIDVLEAENDRLRARVGELEADRANGTGGAPSDAVSELIDLVRRNYVNPGRVDDEKLAIAAFEGIVNQLDHADLILDNEGSPDIGETLRLGAEFYKLDRLAPLVVTKVTTHEVRTRTDDERLRPADRVSAIFGVPTRGLSAQEIRSFLDQLPPKAATAWLEVERWGWETPRLLSIRKVEARPPELTSELLPAGVAYLRLRSFSKGTSQRVGAALDELKTRAGEVHRCILDLRQNRGGVLDEAVGVVDLVVLNRGLPVVTQERAKGETGHELFATDARRIACKMAVLVDGGTASSAEVAAGALQDLERAIVIGTRTYGKGVSQSDIPVPQSVKQLVGRRAWARLPSYYLRRPNGHLFHGPRDRDGQPRGGILPDISVDELEASFTPAQLDEFRGIQHSDALFRYVQERYQFFRDLWAEDPQDLQRVASYPELAALHAALDTSLDAKLVHTAIARVLQRHFADSAETPSACDVRGDRQLQRALAALDITADSDPFYLENLPTELGG